MRIIYRYIIWECIPPFLTGSLFFTLIFVLDKLRQLVELAVEKNTPIDVVMQLFLYMLPFTAAITIPMGVLFGTLMAFGRMSGDSEIIAMRVGGISIYNIFKPIFYFGIIVTIVMFLFINYIMPETNYRFKTLWRSVMVSNPGIILRDRVFSDIPNTQKKISTIDISEDGKTMESVFIYEFDNVLDVAKITFAEHGEWRNNELNSPLITLFLEKGRSIEMNMNNINEFQNLVFDSISLNIVNSLHNAGNVDKGPRELSAFDINKRIQAKIKNKRQVSASEYVEFHKKFSIPAACLIFVIIGMPLGITFQRSGKGMSFGAAIIIIFVYYIFLHLGEVLGYKEHMHPALGMWLPNLVLFFIGTWVFWVRARE